MNTASVNISLEFAHLHDMWQEKKLGSSIIDSG